MTTERTEEQRANVATLTAKLTGLERELVNHLDLTDVQALERIIEVATKMLAQRKAKPREMPADEQAELKRQENRYNDPRPIVGKLPPKKTA
jgi:hypothetical protein